MCNLDSQILRKNKTKINWEKQETGKEPVVFHYTVIRHS